METETYPAPWMLDVYEEWTPEWALATHTAFQIESAEQAERYAAWLKKRYEGYVPPSSASEPWVTGTMQFKSLEVLQAEGRAYDRQEKRRLADWSMAGEDDAARGCRQGKLRKRATMVARAFGDDFEAFKRVMLEPGLPTNSYDRQDKSMTDEELNAVYRPPASKKTGWTAAEMLQFHERMYRIGKPVISDAEFDALEAIVNPDTIGHVPSEAKVELVRPMLSLKKVKSIDAIKKWYESCKKKLGVDTLKWAYEQKIDGIAIELTMGEDWKVLKAVTRGDGHRGMDVTHAFTRAGGIIVNRPVRPGVYHVELSDEAGGGPAKVAGWVRSHSPARHMPRNPRVDEHFRSWCSTDEMELDESWWSQPSLREKIHNTEAQAPHRCEGLVFFISDPAHREALGCTKKYPRWAVAYKWADPGRQSIVRAIRVTEGATGRLTPIVEFEPVLICGKWVSKASAGSPATLKKMGLEVGDRVQVRLAGGIIPQVSRIEAKTITGKKRTNA